MTNRSRESRNPEASVRVVGDSEQGGTRKIYSRPTGSLRRKSHLFVAGIHLFSQDKGGLYLFDQFVDSTPSRSVISLDFVAKTAPNPTWISSARPCSGSPAAPADASEFRCPRGRFVEWKAKTDGISNCESSPAIAVRIG